MTTLLLEGVLQPLVWLLLAQMMPGGTERYRDRLWYRVVRFGSPELIWPRRGRQLGGIRRSTGAALSAPVLCLRRTASRSIRQPQQAAQLKGPSRISWISKRVALPVPAQ